MQRTLHHSARAQSPPQARANHLFGRQHKQPGCKTPQLGTAEGANQAACRMIFSAPGTVCDTHSPASSSTSACAASLASSHTLSFMPRQHATGQHHPARGEALCLHADSFTQQRVVGRGRMDVPLLPCCCTRTAEGRIGLSDPARYPSCNMAPELGPSRKAWHTRHWTQISNTRQGPTT